MNLLKLKSNFINLFLTKCLWPQDHPQTLFWPGPNAVLLFSVDLCHKFQLLFFLHCVLHIFLQFRLLFCPSCFTLLCLSYLFHLSLNTFIPWPFAWKAKSWGHGHGHWACCFIWSWLWSWSWGLLFYLVTSYFWEVTWEQEKTCLLWSTTEVE